MASCEHHRTQSAPRRVSPPRPRAESGSSSPCEAERWPTRAAGPGAGRALGHGRGRQRRSGPGASRSSPKTSQATRAGSSRTSCSRTEGRTGTTPIRTRRDPLPRHERIREALLLERRRRRRRALVRRGSRGARRASSRCRRRARRWAGARRMRRQDEADARWALAHSEWKHVERATSFRCAERVSGRLALKHGLRGMDAVQLASGHASAYAGACPPRLRPTSSSRAFDHRLLEAAEAEGFATLGGPLALSPRHRRRVRALRAASAGGPRSAWNIRRLTV